VTAYRTALVTGASGGIGRAIVSALLQRGMHVDAVAFPDHLLDELRQLDGVTVHGVDVRDTTALATAVNGLEVDVLVNNAGIIGDMQPAQSSTTHTADALIDINLRATVHATLAVLPGMVARRRGHIVFTGSVAGYRPTANSAVYSATKAALHAFADGLRMDLFGTAVRVTVLAPGRVETHLYDAALGGHDAAVERLYSAARAVQPSEIAELVGLAVDMPEHVDVSRIEVVPTGQVFGGSQVAET
jgi:NADP-dependent 3-hydroxy acid dehydrogenase YdfG